MSLAHMLEIAKTQGNVEAVVDAVAMAIDAKRLQASTEILNEHAFAISIKHATSMEVATIVSSLLDVASSDVDVTVVEATDGKRAVVLFDDPELDAAKSLASTSLIDIAGLLGGEDDEDVEENAEDAHASEDDDDVSDDDDEDDEDEPQNDPNKMSILATDEGFKLAQRLQQLACGNDKSEFAHFLTTLEQLLSGFRNRSGYTPPEVQDTASVEDVILEQAFNEFVEEAKKKGKGFKEGRSGFLSAYLKIINKQGENFANAWDSLDTSALVDLFGRAGGELVEEVNAERQKRGLDAPNPDAAMPPEETETASAIAIRNLVSK